jgi:two-component system response regulator HydG
MVGDLSKRHHVPVKRFDDDLLRRLQGYSWPGNIREMRNVVESLMVLSSSRTVGVADLPSNILHTLRSTELADGDERSKILSVLRSADWNRNEAARILSCSRMTLYRKMVKYSISAKKARAACNST